MTEIYYMRHSQTLKFNNINNTDSLQVQNEKWPLTIEGEKIAKELSEKPIFPKFDHVFASKYVRAIATAKYFTNDNILIEEAFGERKFGIKDWSELPEDFYEKQALDFNYKIGDGENLNEVKKREEIALDNILNKYKNTKLLIVGHSTALATLFSKWCNISFKGPYTFQGKAFFDGNWNFCETFKLLFDENHDLISIENIK